jgi:hypothetical protein
LNPPMQLFHRSVFLVFMLENQNKYAANTVWRALLLE